MVCLKILDDDDIRKSAFICYAHQDNESMNPKERGIDRFLQFIKPMVRQHDLNVWSDQDIKVGEKWHEKINDQLQAAKAVVLFVSPAFLDSDYIAYTELPILLKRAKDNGIPIYQFLVSPCMDDETRFFYPDPKTGPDTFTLRSIQAANSPSRTLIEMTEAQQNRVMQIVARNLWTALK